MSSPLPLPRGLLLVGHGTRDPAGQAEFHELAGLVARQAEGWIVAPCFLELAEPSIDAAVERLAAAGVRTLVVAPLLLLTAGHAKRDVPQSVAAARERIGPTFQPAVRECPPLGLHPRIIRLSAARLAEATANAGPTNSESELLMVFRGSSDQEAQAQAHELAARCATESGIARCEVAFVAAARPSLAEALAAAAAGPASRVVVQPHLLFAGDVLREVDESVASARTRWPEKEWLVVPHLGPDPLVAATIWELAIAACDADRAGPA